MQEFKNFSLSQHVFHQQECKVTDFTSAHCCISASRCFICLMVFSHWWMSCCVSTWACCRFSVVLSKATCWKAEEVERILVDTLTLTLTVCGSKVSNTFILKQNLSQKVDRLTDVQTNERNQIVTFAHRHPEENFQFHFQTSSPLICLASMLCL